MSRTVGFVGLGNMGLAMASRLAERGWRLRVYNRSGDKAAPLVAAGATRVDRPEDAAEPGGIVISMLADDGAVESIFGGQSKLVARLGPGGIHLSMSTIHPETSRRLASEHGRAEVTYVAAPVFGRPQAARAGELWIAVSGPEMARERVAPLLAAMGRGSFDFGSDPGAANVVKLCGNFLIAAAVEALGEAAALAAKSGVDPGAVIDMLGKTLFACTIYQGYGRMIAAGQFQPAGFRLALGQKDVALALDAAQRAGVPMPLGVLLRDRGRAAIAKGRGDWDWSALSLGAAEDAGWKRA
ncbi:MAG TPA: NAD(P)-dependent oxidoreductase [Candidatus Acidoferrales bacterium]|nr:NAD(P)-dependent oxidoreductase [Candidatus Acidoferrales bacterium]